MTVYLAGTGSYLPARLSLTDAVATGRVSAAAAARSGLESITVGDTLSAPEMAGRAARDAVTAAGEQLGDGILHAFHAYSDFQGARMWVAASHVARHGAGAHVPGSDLGQACNGAVQAIELGARLLAGAPATGATGAPASVLVTAADRFDSAGIDRWRADPDAFFGDGAGALVLSNVGGPARLLAAATECDNALEAADRGGRFSTSIAGPVDFAGAHAAFVPASMSQLEYLLAIGQVVNTAVKRALAEADCGFDDIAWAVTSTTSRPQLQSMLTSLLPLREEQTTWTIGRTTGHLGPADHLVGLHHLIGGGRARSGDKILVLGGGGGFTCTCAIVEML